MYIYKYKLKIMKSIEVTDNEVKGFLNNDGVSILQFSAPWCGPCQVLGPIIEDLAGKNEDIQVGKISIEHNSNTAAAFGIRSIPTVIFFKDGEKVSQISGVKQLDELQKIVDGLKS